ncbi:Fic family protein [Simkania negevensis]|uniref:Fido domain-containing protein n=1 Tax=Simkania negevensis (strain ATCC VR-1471 / DSM 27360 / Z) TaxID=331113 RepID=F8L8N1_SIMNZ|nr:Fic family protein [Simkania negevensis]CCB89172.1 hypothetical protein SNE_A12950 [Simkania negevensis Z]
MTSISAVSNRTIQFLNESNYMEGIHEIDYANPTFQDPQKGHFGAFTLSQDAGRNHTPLSVKILRTWQALLGKEQQEQSGDHIDDREIGHIRGPSLQKNVRIGKHVPPSYERVPALLQCWVEDFNEDLAKNHEIYTKDDEAFANFAGSYFLRFERIHPFGDGNGRMGRLIANYISAYCNRPLLIFPAEYSLRNRYIEAHESEEAMINYFSQRIAEARS